MKTPSVSLIVLSIAWPAFAAPGQSQTDELHQKALEVLRKTIAETGQPSTTVAATPPNEPIRQAPALTEMEQKYLAGKVSAKQFQKYLQEHPAQSVEPVAPASADTQAEALELLRQIIANAGTVPSPGLAKPGAGSAANELTLDKSSPSPVQPGLSEIEAKMDELLRLKAARDKAAQEKAAAAASPSAPKTKRERLDELLRLSLDGKITDAEYQAKRSKIIAE